MLVTSVKTGRDTQHGRSEEQGARFDPAGHTCAVEKRHLASFMGSRQQVRLLPALLRGCSSAAERSPVERVRTGSNPVIPASMVAVV